MRPFSGALIGKTQYVRARLEAGDYQFGNANRGGPDFYAIEPMGDGTVATTDVNFANLGNFGTTVTNNGFTNFNGTRYNDGLFFDGEGTRTGNTSPANGDAGDYAEIDLKARRRINQAIVVWDYGWKGNAYGISYSTDGINFTPVSGLSAATSYAAGGALGYSFDPVSAQYVRISNVTTATSYALLNQIVVYAVPEPATGLLAAFGGLFLLRRSRR